MKKALLVSLFMFASLLQARFYFGVEGGYSAQGSPMIQNKGKGIEFHITPTKTLSEILKNGAHGYNAGIVLGSESFFGNYFGLRWGLGVGYVSTQLKDNEKKLKLQALSASTNLDMMVNIISTHNFDFGFFGGVEADYQYFINTSSPKIHAVGFLGRGGLSTLLANHHRVELYAKIPFADMSSKFTDGDGSTIASGLQRISFIASYKFVF